MPGSLGTVTRTLFLLLLTPGWVEPQACTFPCQCPSQPLQCPAGTSQVWDACGCCKVCAQQLGELCSLHRPCDHHKGLYCDFSKTHRGSGICLGERAAGSVLVWFFHCASQNTHQNFHGVSSNVVLGDQCKPWEQQSPWYSWLPTAPARDEGAVGLSRVL
ncbi:hypothetical protein Nmel_017444 [Mimus melanotis]